MRKLLLIASCILSFAGANAQVYTHTYSYVSAGGNLTVSDLVTLTHDSTNCSYGRSNEYTVTVNSSFVGDTVNIIDTTAAYLIYQNVNTTGASPWTFTVSLLGGGGADFVPVGYVYHSDPPTTKVVCRLDTVYITTHDSLQINNPCNYGFISGNTYIDNNANCVFDAGDIEMGPFNLNIMDYVSSPPAIVPYYISATAGGTYSYPIQQSWMTSYTVSLPPEYAFIFPNSPCAAGSYTLTTLPASGLDFPLQCTSNIDVECYAFTPVDVRLYTPFSVHPFVNNTGCDTASGQLTLVLDPHAVYDPALSTYPADTVRGDTLIWNYYALNNLSGGAYWNSFFSDVYLTPDSATAVGDTLCFRVYTNILAADINTANNDYTVCVPVVASYDPNEKDVAPKGTGPQGFIHTWQDTLTYNIHFQNTGTSYAANVSITDTLDSHLNASTFKIIGSSHAMSPTWLAPGVVQFNFNNIMLPDSGSDQAGSQGEVRFSVMLNSGLAPGTQIKNTGYIYFDSNPVVVTNTTLNTIAMPTKITPANTSLPVKVYPVPATDHIVVENLDGGEITILNMNGSSVISQNVASNKTTIDVSKLPAGVYILKTVNNNNTTTTKFTKY